MNVFLILVSYRNYRLIVVARLLHGARGEPRGNSLFAYLSRVNKRSAGPYFRHANNTDA